MPAEPCIHYLVDLGLQFCPIFLKREIRPKPHPKMQTGPSVHSNFPGKALSFHVHSLSLMDLDLLILLPLLVLSAEFLHLPSVCPSEDPPFSRKRGQIYVNNIYSCTPRQLTVENAKYKNIPKSVCMLVNTPISDILISMFLTQNISG